MKEVLVKKCPHTGKEFIPKRSNQIYFDREAQIENNNNRTKERRKGIKRQFSIIEKNYFILDDLLGVKSMIRVSKDYLLGRGFHSNYLTHIDQENGIFKMGIYDVLFEHAENNKMVIYRDKRFKI